MYKIAAYWTVNYDLYMQNDINQILSATIEFP